MKNFTSSSYSQHQKMSKLVVYEYGALKHHNTEWGENVGKKDKRYLKFSNFLIKKFVFS